MKRFASLAALAAILIPSLAFAATLKPTTVLFTVDLCHNTVTQGTTVNGVHGFPLCTTPKSTFVIPFGSAQLCAGAYVIKQGAVDVTASYVAANCK